ncbi:Clavaminate synthase-like protein [Coccomyxa subellipsoidea C-169]|uniref:Clavaminate synthase-like protein n=1 Tax=Coccomyxa subellipsoidea (strain C-169) TaxID=574566 RepID=I0YJR4_COCSC|nr:Clavaminate synthase-like protein [Coccomyxa subellipsoidea C-169]EIE18633.1 Clavaminate synthase-like protein [Coccomyxa subellipsoidea C-169]|eukprot:XP_005643177.1 Clavaminate synthase-like protein [Coccomyxa subellipsoidea C-169]
MAYLNATNDECILSIWDGITPPQHLPAHVPAELASCAHAYGLQTASDACRLLAASAVESSDWTVAALDALEVILGNLSRGFKSAGPWRHGLGGREANRLLQNLQGSLEAAQSQMRPSANTGDSTLAAESAVLVIASLDEAYYALLEHHLSCGHETPSVPPPHVYLPAIVAANPGNAGACKRMVRERAPSEGKQLLRKVWGVRKVDGQLALPDKATVNNPLLTVMWARFQEGCRLLYASGLGLQGEMDAAAAAEDKRIRSRAGRRARPGSQAALLQGSAKYCREKAHITKRPRSLQADGDSSSADVSSSNGSEEKQSRDESSDASSADDMSDELAPAWRDGAAQPGESPWPAHRALREWRQAGRECHLYAYAPSTREALDALAERAPLVEVGAGLGYWAAALRAGGVPVLALDSHPPGGAASNSYHGRIPSFTKVAQGGPKAVAGQSERQTLFLGDCVCVVGEWLGDTADESFAAALLAGWRLVRRVPLPNWTDTAHELTIWRRNYAKSGTDGATNGFDNSQEQTLKTTATTDKPAFVIPFKPIDGPTVWYGGDLDDVAYEFTPKDVEEILGAVAAVEKRQLKVDEITREDFVLPTLGPKLETIHKDLIFGRGIRLLRNVPLGLDVTLQQSIIAFWGISTYFGKQVPLTQVGHLVGHVRSDEGVTKRVSNCTPVPLGYHADNSDIVLLGCRSQAPTGGDSSCCSSHALHNEILSRRADLHRVLSEPFYSDRREWWPEGSPPYYKSPFFHYHQNTLGVQEVQANIEEVAEHLGAPPVKPGQVEAVKFVQEIAAEPKVRFDDGASEAEKRHMFRIWIASPLGWPLDPLYAERWQTVAVGERGGLEVRPPFKRHDFNDWFALYGSKATTEHLKPAASRAQKQDILRKFYPALDSSAKGGGEQPALIRAEA